jgi:hypothetical protein
MNIQLVRAIRRRRTARLVAAVAVGSLLAAGAGVALAGASEPSQPSLPPGIEVAGDWNGDGVDTPGFFDPRTATWQLRNSNTTGRPDV